jgi:hypothetical protein
MQYKSDLIHIKRKTLLFLLIAFLVLGATPVLADYLGPDRTTTESYEDTYDYGVWARDNNTIPYCLDKQGNKADDCIVCEWKRKPGNACGDATYWYTLGSRSEIVEKTTNLPPAIISSSLQSCTLNNGWCVTAPELSLNGSEPLSGYAILAIEGSLNGQSFACSGDNCIAPLNEGANDFFLLGVVFVGRQFTDGNLLRKSGYGFSRPQLGHYRHKRVKRLVCFSCNNYCHRFRFHFGFVKCVPFGGQRSRDFFHHTQ